MKYVLAVFLLMLFFIFVLCLFLKNEKKQAEEMKNELEESIRQNEINANYNRENIKNEEKMAEILGGNKLDNFNSGISWMQELAEKGKKRNS